MMKCSEYYGVQFAQGQFLMHWESGEYLSVVEKLFSKEEDISVCYEGLKETVGRESVIHFFEEIKEMSEKNGGFLRADLPHTQKIVISEDGIHASGQWETMTLRVMGAAFSNDLIQAPLDYAIGKYDNQFVLEEGYWKIKSINWKPVVEFGDWKAKDARQVYNRPYPKPFEKISKVDDQTSSEEAVKKVNIRNELMSFFSDFNAFGIGAIDKRFHEDAAREAKRMLQTELQINGYWGSVLATSPIVSVDGDYAYVYATIGRILPVGEKEIAHSRGRVCIEMQFDGTRWIFEKFEWFRYATLEPWKVRRICVS